MPLTRLAAARILTHKIGMTRHRRPLAGLALALGILAAAPAHGVEAPYEKPLLRLAEVLGSIHYLRNLCGEAGQEWRERMEALLEAEAPPPARRARMVASFNHGYRSFEASYAVCTESARAAIRRYMKEGAELSSDIAARYGN